MSGICGRCGGGRAPSAAQTPCPGFAASVPAQRLVALSEIGTIVCVQLGGRQWWVQYEESSHGAVAGKNIHNKLLLPKSPSMRLWAGGFFPERCAHPYSERAQVAQCAGDRAREGLGDELCRKRRLNSDY